jgi:patatin-like phospholipase/acyl hydrolase
MGGTSAGGLNALLLGRLGLSIGDAIKIFEELSPQIFGVKRSWISTIFGKNRFDHMPLEKALKKLCDEDLLKDNSNAPMYGADGSVLRTRVRDFCGKS